MFPFVFSDMQSTATSMFSAYASFAAFMMMFRSLANELLPEPLRSYLISFFPSLFKLNPFSSSITITIDQLQSGYSRNEMFDAAEIYLSTKINPTTKRFKVSKTYKNKNLNIRFEKNQEIIDTFEKFTVKWTYINNNDEPNKKLFELSFDQKFKDKVLEEYLPYVLKRANEIKYTNKVVKLYSMHSMRSSYNDEDEKCSGVWGSINLDHPSTFETLAMEPEMKKGIIDDLERFLKRRDYYKKVGKAWKRGYLLYGPPGTGKSSLVAAMANYLNFDIYELELTSIYSNSELRRMLVSTNNRSIIVIEDIDCSAQMHDREDDFHYSDPNSKSKLTLSGMLNFIDGLWSSCGDERIIIFTTNHKDRLDPALLRPGRMDLHIHMSYCTYPGFKLLASNYLGINDHNPLFGEIEELLENVQVTPAEIAEELMRSEDPDIALAGIVKLLERKKIEASDEFNPEEGDVDEERTDGFETNSDRGRSEKRGVRGLRLRRLAKDFRLGQSDFKWKGREEERNNKFPDKYLKYIGT